MKKFPDESTLIESLSAAELETALEYAQGRMKKKVLGAQEALQGGVAHVVIADGRSAAPISAALKGSGTHIN
jgi:acetylglutamate/LysW-gamma-L-alpha-aminoadipate kinase